MIQLEISDETYKKIEEAAKAENQTIQEWIENAIRMDLDIIETIVSTAKEIKQNES